MSQRNRPSIQLPGQPAIDKQIALAEAQRQSVKTTARDLLMACLTGCIGADYARAMAIEDERQRRDPGSLPAPLRLEARKAAQVAQAYAQEAFKVITGQVEQPQQAQPQQQAKAG